MRKHLFLLLMTTAHNSTAFTYRQTAIVKKYITLLEFPKRTLLLVLLDRVSHFISCDFVLFSIYFYIGEIWQG